MEESFSDPTPFNFLSRNSSKKKTDDVDAAPMPPRPAVRFDPEDEFYDMSGEKRLVIFNHRRFQSTKYFNYRRPSERTGTEEDCRRIKEVFGDQLGFKVVHHEDKTYDDLWKILNEIREQDYSTVSCLCIVILTHGGRKSELYAANRPYYLDDVIRLFERHPTLATKPKLFFIQACRGDLLDSGSRVVRDGPEDNQIIVVPSHVDFLVMRSTVENFVSWRDYRGSWLIQELCHFVEKYHSVLDILHIITLVNKEIAFKYSTFSANVNNRDKKQTPETVFTLSKFLKFS